MAHIYLIRHGQASFGSHNYDRLSSLGERQAGIVGVHLKALGAPLSAVYSGDMVRQADTADLAAREHGNLPARAVDAAFNEYDADGLFRGLLPRVLQNDPLLAEIVQHNPKALYQDRKNFQRAFEQLVKLWLAGEKPPRGELESWVAFVARVEAGLARLHERHGKDEHVAVFTSGGAIAVSVRAALGLSDEKTLGTNWTIANASITRLRSRPAGYALGSFNNITHLELVGDPALVTYR